MEKKLKNRVFLKSFRIQVVRDIESGKTTQKDAALKYGIKGHSTIFRWLKMYGNGRNNSNDVKKRGNVKEDKESLEARLLKNEIKELKNELERARVKNIFLETMVDVAEETLDISIRKKYGARQLKK